MKKGSYYILLRDQKMQNYKIKKMQGYILEVNELTFGLCLYGKTWKATALYNGLSTYEAEKLCVLKNICIKNYSIIKHIIDVDESQAEYKRIYDKLIEEDTAKNLIKAEKLIENIKRIYNNYGGEINDGFETKV